MSLQATAAHSSRITKPRRKSAVAALGLKRKTPSSSTATPKRLSLPSETSTPYDDEEPLDDTGVITSLTSDLNFRDVPQYMEYIRSTMFSPMPSSKTGMNSTRIAEVLNFRRRLPPFVTIAHIEALSTSPTRTEREIAELSKAGILRRVTIPHRGVGAAAVGDGVASVREWQSLMQAHDEVPEDLKGTTFTPPELAILVSTGFLTSSSPLLASLSTASLAGPSLVTQHPSGTPSAAAASKASTQHIHGGAPLSSHHPSPSTPYTLSLPNMGLYLKLLLSARNHLLSLLKKTRHNEMPLSVLQERWDGGVVSEGDERAERKGLRGEFKGVLPGRTRKWKAFYGMRCDWVVRECVGAGLVEVFETGSVGRGVRVVR
ncbi:hypothetical protein yc1106_07068 [Curvularia clavata]|uniref:Serine-threonine protein kinase 19-domain-containing protein n=1 Tax=Curvularia clavata TaxID=95742 RepID=A0A9Q9DVE8_CURCL|nr:hypothetical protein yc1106_07068 [Curvularia clavata]